MTGPPHEDRPRRETPRATNHLDDQHAANETGSACDPSELADNGGGAMSADDGPVTDQTDRDAVDRIAVHQELS